MFRILKAVQSRFAVVSDNLYQSKSNKSEKYVLESLFLLLSFRLSIHFDHSVDFALMLQSRLQLAKLGTLGLQSK